MIKRIIYISLIIISLSFAIDPLLLMGIQNDKALHGASGYIITDKLETQNKWKWYETLAAMYVIGMIKEQVDVSLGGKWDTNDIHANAAGWLMYRLVHYDLKF